MRRGAVSEMSDDTPIRGTYVLDARDVMQMVEAKSWRNARPKWAAVLIGTGLGLLVLSGVLGISEIVKATPGLQTAVARYSGAALSLAFGLGMITMVAMSFASRPFVYRKVRRQLGPPGQNERLSANSVTLDIEDDVSKRSYQWSAFDDATRFKDVVILWRRDEVAGCVPARAFASDAEAQRFLELALSRIAR